jgi:23S rRNA (uracil1939-C5)-methyltransferase
MNHPQVNQLIKLSIHNIGHHGEGVGSYEGYTVFVDGALPGETIEARLTQCQKRFGRAELISIIESSPDRVKPPCPLFGQCGGCQIMHLSYSKQLEIKQNRVVDAFERIGKIKDVKVLPCIASPGQLQYRNKIQLPVRQGLKGIEIGLYARSSHHLIEVENCFIHCPLGEKIYRKVQQIIKGSKIKPYNPQTGEGELRHVLIRSTVHTHEALVILVTNGDASKHLLEMAEQISLECPDVKGVIQNINQRQDNVILGKEYKLLEGLEYIQEVLCGLQFKLSPASFFQVNPLQAESLYKKALELADISGQETVLDAYCGVGTLSLIFSKFVKKVIGVECCAEAIEDAKENSRLNKIDNVKFVCAPAEDYIKKLDSMDIALLNPPRQGCDPVFLKSIGRILPKTLIYISCDPATLARDLGILYTFGYKVQLAQPFDMFPQTAHVECVVKLKLM